VCGALQVQHGALQSACVLLTSGLQAKIGDVGLAQLAEPTLQQLEDHNCEASTQLPCIHAVTCLKCVWLLIPMYVAKHSHDP
jgi:hypothetical protein